MAKRLPSKQGIMSPSLIGTSAYMLRDVSINNLFIFLSYFFKFKRPLKESFWIQKVKFQWRNENILPKDVAFWPIVFLIRNVQANILRRVVKIIWKLTDSSLAFILRLVLYKYSTLKFPTADKNSSNIWARDPILSRKSWLGIHLRL